MTKTFIVNNQQHTKSWADLTCTQGLKSNGTKTYAKKNPPQKIGLVAEVFPSKN